MAPEKAFDFFVETQKAFYRDNKDTGNISTYTAIATELGIDVEVFESKFMSIKEMKATKEEFKLTSN